MLTLKDLPESKELDRAEMSGVKGGFGPDITSIIQLRSEHERVHAAFPVVVAGLQQRCRFSCVHRRVIEVELGHGAI